MERKKFQGQFLKKADKILLKETKYSETFN